MLRSNLKLIVISIPKNTANNDHPATKNEEKAFSSKDGSWICEGMKDCIKKTMNKEKWRKRSCKGQEEERARVVWP